MNGKRRQAAAIHNLNGSTPIQFIHRVLATLCRRTQQAAHAFTPPDRNFNRPDLCCFLHRHWQVVAFSARSNTGLRRGVDWSFLHRKKQTGNVSVSALVIHWRLQNDLADADRPDGRRS